MAVRLENVRREGLAAHHVHGLAVFLQLVDERNKIAVAADDRKRVDMGVGKGHLQRIERQIDISPILVTARAGQPLHHLYSILCHLPGCAFLAAPVCVGEFRNNVATLFQCIETKRYVEFPA